MRTRRAESPRVLSKPQTQLLVKMLVISGLLSVMVVLASYDNYADNAIWRYHNVYPYHAPSTEFTVRVAGSHVVTLCGHELGGKTSGIINLTNIDTGSVHSIVYDLVDEEITIRYYVVTLDGGKYHITIPMMASDDLDYVRINKMGLFDSEGDYSSRELSGSLTFIFCV